MRDTDGTLVFVEVRARRNASFGGAAASVSAVKQRRIVFAARFFLARLAAVIESRKGGDPGKSWTAKLLADPVYLDCRRQVLEFLYQKQYLPLQ